MFECNLQALILSVNNVFAASLQKYHGFRDSIKGSWNSVWLPLLPLCCKLCKPCAKAASSCLAEIPPFLFILGMNVLMRVKLISREILLHISLFLPCWKSVRFSRVCCTCNPRLTSQIVSSNGFRMIRCKRQYTLRLSGTLYPRQVRCSNRLLCRFPASQCLAKYSRRGAYYLINVLEDDEADIRREQVWRASGIKYHSIYSPKLPGMRACVRAWVSDSVSPRRLWQYIWGSLYHVIRSRACRPYWPRDSANSDDVLGRSLMTWSRDCYHVIGFSSKLCFAELTLIFLLDCSQQSIWSAP